jgi:hypothetical protein
MDFNEKLIEQLKLKIEYLEDESKQNKILIDDLNLEKVYYRFDAGATKNENQKLRELIRKLKNG